MTTTYFFDKANQTNAMSMQRQTTLIIDSFFAKFAALVGKPVIRITSDKVIVQLFYYAPTKPLSNSGIGVLGIALTQC